MKRKKLNQLGFSHIIMPVLVVLAIASVGTYVLAKSHADTSDAFSEALAGGTCLDAGQKVSYDNGTGKTGLYMLADGNAVLYYNAATVWSTGTSGSGNKLCMQTGGNVVVESSTSKILWQSYTAGVTIKGSSSSLNTYQLDFIARNNDVTLNGVGVMITRNPTSFAQVLTWVSYQRNELDLWEGDELTIGQSLVSPDGSHRATLQIDGNLVIYHGAIATWSSNTTNSTIRALGATGEDADDVNSLVLVDNAGTAVWSGPQYVYNQATDFPNVLQMQNNGNLVVYSQQGLTLWDSGTAGK